jgi:glutamate dehydrogenase
MNYLLRHNVHQVKADIFIPGGGRPRTLNEANFKDFLDEAGKPTAKAIVEGANLYLTPLARRALEKLGTLIIKDSSSNKGGVICSSFEVLSSLCLNEKEFLAEKPALVQEILEIIGKRAKEEAQLLLRSHQTSQAFLTDISEWISERINSYMYELLDYLQPITLSNDPSDPLIRALLNYCPPLLRQNYTQRILKEIPDIHKKAIIACHIASRLVYHRGLGWSPSVVDVLPLIAQDPYIVGST